MPPPFPLLYEVDFMQPAQPHVHISIHMSAEGLLKSRSIIRMCDIWSYFAYTWALKEGAALGSGQLWFTSNLNLPYQGGGNQEYVDHQLKIPKPSPDLAMYQLKDLEDSMMHICFDLCLYIWVVLVIPASPQLTKVQRYECMTLISVDTFIFFCFRPLMWHMQS